MIVARNRVELLASLGQWRASGRRVGMVPTMGNLHAGHLRLVGDCLQRADKTVVTIFVNPTQFGEGEDFSTYPRTESEDLEALKSAGADLVFVPEEKDIYPYGRDLCARVSVGEIGSILCGASRPGHFDGVATVVARLFALCYPDVAVFGEKDYQQLLIIRRLVHDLGFASEVIGIPTVRESDGLAMSSRNRYLSAQQRAIAPRLNAALHTAANAIARGADVASVEAAGVSGLADAGFDVDYFECRVQADLSRNLGDTDELIMLAAARLGKARLIDNVAFRRDT